MHSSRCFFVAVVILSSFSGLVYAQHNRAQDDSAETSLNAVEHASYSTVSYLALHGGIITNIRRVGALESSTINNSPVFDVGLSQEILGSTLFENSRFRSSYSLGLVFGAFRGNLWSDIISNYRFQTSIGYIMHQTTYQGQTLNLYPFVGLGTQRFRPDSVSGRFSISVQGGIGVDYLFANGSVILGTRCSYHYTIASIFVLPKNIVPNQSGIAVQLYTGVRF